MTQKPETIAEQVESAQSHDKGLPPLDKWNPELSGDIDIVIARDGQWLYEGKPIGREAIVRLFSTILRREEDGHYYLVTPVEKWRITVEDAPLLAHSLHASGDGREQVLTVTTNTGETIEVGGAHPLEVGTYAGSDEPRPVVKVRHGVEARLVTAAYYDLAELVTEETIDGKTIPGVWSNGNFYKIATNG
ncbi:DUF1285 domain-containing protein [Marinobacter orientalis]|uniref:DUF1285 domain-containing protein n=1 Tax=Marinobacter orientalis TaxID=1928859 RepID=A0A7Y0RCF5_9GAMM|nr:DUF1285 domain-containing protein [Marinobacter orientalis]NMT63667.1 DUF1285 domain-containing protein [Marinobacter orientalis]TGX49782.1 DUF1285 domain-containing protein [Marinobacter orientalis]